MTKKTNYILLFTLFIISSCSVDRDPCLLPKTTSLRVGSYKIDTSGNKVDSVLAKPIWIALRPDSLIGSIYYSSAKFSLLLSSIHDSCRYILQPDSATASFDTLTFFYDRQLQFLSNACGYTYYFNLKSIRSTYNNIDSVKLTNPEVNTNANTAEHVQIYF
jgi:hypothetical protein